MGKISLKIRIFFLLVAFVLTIVVSNWLKEVPQTRVGDHVISFPQKSSVHLLIIGDTGTGDENQMKVAGAMEEYCRHSTDPIDGIVMLGDNIYMIGVESEVDKQWQDKVEVPYNSECLKNIPIYPVFGNHDYRGNAGAQILYSTKNLRWKFPYRFYSVEFTGILKFIGFDSSFPDMCLLPEYCTVDFMRQQLKNSQAPWKIVFAHHPLASASVRGYGHSGGIFGFLMKPLVCGVADFWIAGHSHHLEHRQESGCKTELFVSGGGGADLYDYHQDQKETLFAKKSFGFLALKATTLDVKTQFIDADNQMLYEYSKSKSSN